MDRDFCERIARPRVFALCVLAITMLLGGTARADKVDDLTADLDNSSDRVRISAVLALTRTEAPKAIPGLVKRLLDTGESKNIRGLAATALGRTVQNGSPNAAQKKQAIDALQKAQSDP